MTASRSRKKSGEHKKPKQRKEPIEMEKPVEKQVKKLGLEVEILAVVVAITIIAIVYLLYVNSSIVQDQPEKSHEDETGVKTCVERNPGMTEQGCTDMEYQEKAVLDNDPEICKLIVSEDVRNHCLRYFGLYR